MRKQETVKLTLLAVTVSIAMILSFIESKIPPLVAIPGIKVGLANIAVIFALYKLGVGAAISVSLVRVVLVSLLFGNPVSMIYSISGACLSLLIMILLKKLTGLGEVGISVTGGIAHNVGQIAAASVMMETAVVVYYLPFLLLSGTLAGIAVGAVSALLIRKIKYRSFLDYGVKANDNGEETE